MEIIMKKICILLLVAMLISLLPACGDKEDEMTPTVNDPTANPNAAVILDCVTLTMPIGAEMEIKASVIPRFDSDDTTATFESANPAVATVTADSDASAK